MKQLRDFLARLKFLYPSNVKQMLTTGATVALTTVALTTVALTTVALTTNSFTL